MSDSDSDFDFDFISGAANKVQGQLKTIRSTSQKTLSPETPKDVSDVSALNESIVNLETPDPSPKLNVSVNITPPRTPVATPVVRKKGGKRKKNNRGYVRTQKTSKALAKLETAKNRTSDSEDESDSDEITVLDGDKMITSNMITVKIRWKHQIKRFQANTSEPLGVMFDRFSKMVGSSSSLILFYLDGKALNRNETLGSVGVDVTSIVEARLNLMTEVPLIQVKLQTKEKRNEQILKIKPSEKFRSMMEKYAAMTKSDISKIKFFFDGEEIDPDSTPDDLELEGGECIDVY